MPGRAWALKLQRGGKIRCSLPALAKSLVQLICKRSHTFIKNVSVSSLLPASAEDEPGAGVSKQRVRLPLALGLL